MSHTAEHHWSNKFGYSPEVEALDEWLKANVRFDLLFLLSALVIPGYSVAVARDEYLRAMSFANDSRMEKYIQLLGSDLDEQIRRLIPAVEETLVEELTSLLNAILFQYDDKFTDRSLLRAMYSQLVHIRVALLQSSHLGHFFPFTQELQTNLDAVIRWLSLFLTAGTNAHNLELALMDSIDQLHDVKPTGRRSYLPPLELFRSSTFTESRGILIKANFRTQCLDFEVKGQTNGGEDLNIEFSLDWRHFEKDADLEEIIPVGYRNRILNDKDSSEAYPEETKYTKGAEYYSLQEIRTALDNWLQPLLLEDRKALGIDFKRRDGRMVLVGWAPAWVKRMITDLEVEES